jgi:hypothetical protein
MKVYKCDSCGRIMSNPYKERMIKFYVGCHFDFGAVFSENCKRSVKIHLCENCYHGLHLIAEKKRSDNNAE